MTGFWNLVTVSNRSKFEAKPIKVERHWAPSLIKDQEEQLNTRIDKINKEKVKKLYAQRVS